MNTTRTSNQKRASTRIAVGFVAIVLAGWYGNRLYSQYKLSNEHFGPVLPGKVNLVGISPGAGYKIIVENRIAQLVETSGDFGANESSQGGPTEGAIKKRIPVDGMIQVMQGNASAVGPFVMSMNGLNENDEWPPIRVVWTAENLKKAFAGDATLKAKLEGDLNVHLDGAPLPTLRIASMENGIILDYPVEVTVHVNGQEQKIVGRIQEPYKPLFSKNVEAQYADRQVTKDDIVGYYATEAAEVKTNKALSENIEKSIEDHIDPQNAKLLEAAADRVLASAVIVVSDKYIDSASDRSYDTAVGKMYDLTIDLNDEGRRRLWKYSHDKVGSVLLLVSDGIPIAAPRINSELAQGELTINQMQDEDLLKEAEDILNHKPNGGTS